jgi:hypothetical protein
VTNHTGSLVRLEVLGGPQPPSPYVTGFVTGVPFPGMTLGPGACTGPFALATVTINPFDPSLPYPGFVDIVLPALDGTGKTLGERPLSIEVVRTVREPSVVHLVGSGCVFLLMFPFLQLRKTGVRALQNPVKSL